MTSTDLVNWTYVGDAFPLDGGDIPAWIDPTAAFWAPDVVYSSATDQYYLFVTVTETTAAGGGSDTCRRRQRHRRRGRRQPDRSVDLLRRAGRPAARDPSGGAVLRTSGPSTRTSSVTPSPTRASSTTARYYGGMFATDVTFTEDGVTAATADTADDTRIAIGNRYEGANVVYRDGYYYLFASATNCCNGALTGYSVFVGRSTSPFGPFVDREGNSFLDAARRRHAVPHHERQPLGRDRPQHGLPGRGRRSGGRSTTPSTRRTRSSTSTPGSPSGPPCSTRSTGSNGWPTVNGGAGASDGKMPAPAAQEGQRSRYQTKLVKPQVVEPAPRVLRRLRRHGAEQ